MSLLVVLVVLVVLATCATPVAAQERPTLVDALQTIREATQVPALGGLVFARLEAPGLDPMEGRRMVAREMLSAPLEIAPGSAFR